jgi:hypothetical protein
LCAKELVSDHESSGNLKFVLPMVKTVEEMLDELPRDEQVMVNRLRALIHECLPKASEKGYYGVGVPFYSHNRMICFIWPSSVSWGPKHSPDQKNKKGLSLGFCQGNLMSNEDGLLKSEGRKQVFVLHLHSSADIDDAVIRSLLFEAGLIDDSFRRRPKQKNKFIR